MTEEESLAALGVGPDATGEELKRAYRRKLRLNHPDLNGGNHERSVELVRAQEAYRTLEQRRRGIGLHDTTPAKAVQGSSGAARRSRDRRRFVLPTRRQIHHAWRRWALLPILGACVIVALGVGGRQGGAPSYMAYHWNFLAAIAAAIAAYGLGTALLAYWARK